MFAALALMITAHGAIASDSACVDDGWCASLGEMMTKETCDGVPLIKEKCPLSCGVCEEEVVPIREDPADLIAEPEPALPAACGTTAGFDMTANTSPFKLRKKDRISYSAVGADVSECLAKCMEVECKSFVHATNSRGRWNCHIYSKDVMGTSTKSRRDANIYSIQERCQAGFHLKADTAAPTPTPTAPVIECKTADNAGICISHGLTAMLCASNNDYRTKHCPFMCGTCTVPYSQPTEAPAIEAPATGTLCDGDAYKMKENSKPKNLKRKNAQVGESDGIVSVDDCKTMCNEAAECAMFAYKVPVQKCFLFNHVKGGNNNRLVNHRDWQMYIKTETAGCVGDNNGNATPASAPTPPPTPGGIVALQPEVSTPAPSTPPPTPPGSVLFQPEASTPAPAPAGPAPYGASLGCSNGWKMDTKKAYGPKSIEDAVGSVLSTTQAVDNIACFVQCFEEKTCAAAHYQIMDESCTLYDNKMSDVSSWKVVGRAHSSGFIVCA